MFMRKLLLFLSLFTSVAYAGTPPPVLGGASGNDTEGYSRILPGPADAMSAEGRNYLSEYLAPGVINGFLMILFFLGVTAIVVAGLFYVLSSGDQEMTKKAKDIIFWAITGTIIAAMAYGMVRFVVNLDFYGEDLSASVVTQDPVSLDTDVLFPTWVSDGRENEARPEGAIGPLPEKDFVKGVIRVKGIIGRNKDLEISDTQRGEKALMVFIPRIIDILFYAVAPIVVVMFVFSGVRFIYAGDSEEDITSSKKMFQYALMGTIFMVLSFSFMKVTFMILDTTVK